MSPLVSGLVHSGLVEAEAYNQIECFAAGVQFARAEGIIPAPEATHAIKAAIADYHGKNPKASISDLAGTARTLEKETAAA